MARMQSFYMYNKLYLKTAWWR